jgi:MoaA/NifB/PqqE/SkfB family radical SAM enzyme
MMMAALLRLEGMWTLRLREQFRQALDSHLKTSEKLPFLLNDMVIEEQLCQMRCAYCLTEEFNLLMNVPDARMRLTEDRSSEWTAALDAFHEQVDTPILRLSGGEFFWLKGSTEFVEECALRYETVQVITNGVFLTEDRLSALARLPNVQLNISLDGHTLELNKYRFPERQRKLFPVIMANLDAAIARGMRIEIQSVLTDANVAGQARFAEYLRDRYDERVMLYFFPSRGNTFKSYAPPPGNYLGELVERYDEFSGVLPPRPYVEHIHEQLQRGERTLACHVTATMAQLFGSGEVSACPHAWIEPMGNVREDAHLMPREFARHQHYELFMQDPPRFSFCKSCATPSDVINLYYLDRISDAEMERCALYSGPRSLSRLRELKSIFRPILQAASRHPG